MKIEFKEVQKFTQWWLWVILIGIAVIPIYGIYKQLIIGEKFGDQPMSDVGLIIFSIFIFGLLTLFWFMRLKTKINQEDIQIDFYPFVKKRVHWKEIKSAEIVNYGFVGGWGIRLWTKYGTVYNTKGNTGLAVVLLNGKKFLIGTQKASELNKLVKKSIAP
jgi:hypothetical protein